MLLVKNLSEIDALLERMPFSLVLRTIPGVLLIYEGRKIFHLRQANDSIFHPLLQELGLSLLRKVMVVKRSIVLSPSYYKQDFL